MSGNGRGGYLATYEFVDDRIQAFRKDYPGIMGKIETFDLSDDKAILWRAEISVRDLRDESTYHLIANGHARDPWAGNSQYEKTEKAAIGRALVVAGYSSKAGASAEEMELHHNREAREPNHVPAVVNRTRGPILAHPVNTPPPATVEEQDARIGAVLAAVATPEPGDRMRPAQVGRPAYRTIVEKAQDKTRDGGTFDQAVDYFRARRKQMTEEEYADAKVRLGEIKAYCQERDELAAAAAEMAEDGIVGAPPPDDVI